MEPPRRRLHPQSPSKGLYKEHKSEFAQYLQMFDPAQEYSMEYLGTNTNVTFRVTKKDQPQVEEKGEPMTPDVAPDAEFNPFMQEAVMALNVAPEEEFDLSIQGAFRRLDSFIVKFPPTYPFCPLKAETELNYRQRVEANALTLFGPGSQLEMLIQNPYGSIFIPQFLHRDSKSNVLFISDIGKLVPLSEHLLDLRDSQNGLDLQSAYHIVGNCIGVFFGHLHAPSTIAQIPFPDFLEYWRDLNLGSLNRWEIYKIKEFLEKHMKGQNHKKLRCIMEDDWWHGHKLAGARVVAHGNVSAATVSVFKETLSVGIIGWQFSGPGRGLNGDMAQLVAAIRAVMFECKARSDPLYISSSALLRGITASYRRTSRESLTKWSVDGSEVSCNCSRSLPPPTAAILRSTFIAYGTAMFRLAMLSKNSFDGDGGQGTHSALSKWAKAVLLDGYWHVEMAGVDGESFLKNWQVISRRGSPLLALVLGD